MDRPAAPRMRAPGPAYGLAGCDGNYSVHCPSSRPWKAAGDWWNVYGTVVDVGCLIGLRNFTRKEGIRLRDLIGHIRLRHGRDLFLGLAFFVAIFPFFTAASYVARRLLYSSSAQDSSAYLIHGHTLPIWAMVCGLSFWWVIWSPTEEITYQGYALPRLEALTGHTWVAFVIVDFFWAAQHCALPFIPDWRYLLFRFLTFLPGVLILILFYLPYAVSPRSSSRIGPWTLRQL